MSRLYFYSLLLSFCCVSCSKQPTSAGTTPPVQGGTNNPDTIGHNIVLYGITWQGGSNNLGTIFRIHGDGTNFESLYNFDAGSGGHCYTGLCQAPNGKFYGVSANNFFSFDPAGNKVELLSGGAVISPVDQVFSGFTLASDGKLYSGASDGLFAVEPASGTLKYVYKYLSSDGRSPIRGRLTAYNDLLYGALPNGGSDLLGEGTLFSFKPSTNSFRKLHDFTGTDTLGGVPLANICVGANNTLYGYTLTTGKLSDTAGILYKYNLGNNTFSRISRLNLENGYSPFCNSGLIQTSASDFYGAQPAGGFPDKCGFIAMYNANSNIYSIKYRFSAAKEGIYSNIEGLMKASNGYLYGISNLGGSAGGGSIFRFNPANNTVTVIYNFSILNTAKGVGPRGNLEEAKF